MLDIHPRARPHEFPALTGLRGVLALWVVLYHATCGIEFRGVDLAAFVPWPPLNVLHSGAMAVEMFFVLSGFIMVHVHGQDFSASRADWSFVAATIRFWLLRLIRLWPVHAVVIAIYAGLDFAGFPWDVETCGNPQTHGRDCDRFALADLPSQLLLTAGWGAADVYGWNFVSWSVSAEWLAYVAFPVLAFVIVRISWGVALILAIATLAASVPYHLWLGPTFHGLSDSYSAFRVIPGFLAGCLLAQCLVLDANPAVRSVKPQLALLMTIALVAMTATRGAAMWAIIPGAFLILALSEKVPRGLAAVLSSRPLLALGQSSYSLYMSHFLVLEVLGRLTATKQNLASTGPRLAVSLLATTLACVLVARVFYYLVEDPARRRLRAMLKLG